MKCSETWLREWVNPKQTCEQLADALTMAGLEVESIHPAAGIFSGIVVGSVLNVQKHPEADRLTICEVDVGQAKPLTIVCGASNVRAGIKVPTALLDAILPDKMVITPTTLKGVTSHGMLCSAKELGLSEESEGLLLLSNDAPIGKDINAYLQLDDHVIDVSITPNRGDCLSVKGLARDLSAITHTAFTPIKINPIKATIKDTLPVNIKNAAGCPVYFGRVIRGINPQAETPVWMKERLRRSGARCIHPVVDVTNYVMLELGQPMHAFDLQTIKQEIEVRLSHAGEKIKLLDESEQTLDAETLVIADKEKALAIAGVMGGMNSCVTADTKDIFLESAFFTPTVIARQRQYYNLNSDSAYRFERGVDYTLQRDAIERATQLILEIAGGEVGPVIEQEVKSTLPKTTTINLSAEQIKQLLGMEIPAAQVEKILTALQFTWKADKSGWQITPPAHRFDIVIAEDVIEELARLYGFDKIPTHTLHAALKLDHIIDRERDFDSLRYMLANAGYHELITYSFVDEKLQKLLDPNASAKRLKNPITADMTMMRTNLWSGLINTLLYNKSRQQNRLRLFEIGTCFIFENNKLNQLMRLGGLAAGTVVPEQWGEATRDVDFYDVKGDLEQILKQSFKLSNISFSPAAHPALHPGQTAGIYVDGKQIGILGALHPFVLQTLDLPGKAYFVYEINLNLLHDPVLHRHQEVSRFPEIRRDLALLVNQTIPAKAIQDTIKEIAGDWLKDVFIFDVYQGKGISPGLKSIAVGLIWQHSARTLVDDEITEMMTNVISTLKRQLGAELRS